MSDGPFKNLKLGKRWKQFAEAAQNDAFGRAECCALAKDAIVRDILIDGVQELLAVLQAYASQKQLDFDPMSSVENIFNCNTKTPFVDILQKEMAFRLCEQIAPSDAIRQALDASVEGQISESGNRIAEECIRAREAGEMRQDQFDHTIKQTSAILSALSRNDICEALLAGDKNAFKDATLKKEGLDEGPSL